MKRQKNGTVVLAYSGGLDTSVCVHWLAQRGYRVIAFMADVGQGEPSAAAIRRGRVAGASRIIVRDLRHEFITRYIWPALKAHAVYEGGYLLATALSRPLIARHLVDVSHQLNADTVAHGCTGKGNDQVRFEMAIRMLDPALRVLAPVREWEFKSRQEEVEYCRRHGIPIDVSKRSPYSIDQNLWGTSIEAGVLEDPWTQPPDDAFLSIRPPAKTAGKPVKLTIGFRKGIPTHVNGRAYGPVQLVSLLNKIGGEHGVGRCDMIESRVVGIKSREIYESPGGTILLEAHRDLERLVLDRELLSFKQTVAKTYSHLVYAGFWHSPLKQALDAFVDHSQSFVTGEVRVELFKGRAQVMGRRSAHSLYRPHLATYSTGDQFDQSLAAGFIRLFGLPYEGIAAKTRMKHA